MSIEFENKIDVGHMLTLLTLAAGFIWWIYSTQREWRDKKRGDSRSGALRLLLRILRELQGVPVSLVDLHEMFKSDDLKIFRKAYCKRDWKFDTDADFEAAIYRLDWEGKIYFVSPHEIIFRVDRHQAASPQFNASGEDKSLMLATLKSAIANNDIDSWQLEKLAESCMQVAPELTSTLLREALKSNDEKVRLRITPIIGNFTHV